MYDLVGLQARKLHIQVYPAIVRNDIEKSLSENIVPNGAAFSVLREVLLELTAMHQSRVKPDVRLRTA